jgi:pyruvate,water dikinase
MSTTSPIPRHRATASAYVVAVRAGEPAPPTALVGGKAHNLARLVAAGADVPPWIAITTAAFRDLALRGRAAPATEAKAWQDEIRRAELPADFVAELRAALADAGLDGQLVAVRSSAAAEDGAVASFAGQFDSVLGVRADTEADDGLDELLDAVRRVWASAASAHALRYGGGETPMGVVIQAMIDAEAAGVAFGADPLTGRRDVVVVSAVHGLGEPLVSGEVDADSYRVTLGPTGEVAAIAHEVAEKPAALRLDAEGGTRWVEVPEAESHAPALADDEIRALATAVRGLEAALGAPQDVEWAVERGADGMRRLWLLQARPITTLADAGERRIWDNSNIVESYAGVTSPLTFSFARSVYEDVYRQFCALVGVPAGAIERERHAFAHMLGLVRGRVYYNLLHWYRVLALLPGFRVNRAFMERMMGVRERLDDDALGDTGGGRAADAARLVRMVYRLVRESRRLRTAVPAFHAHVERVLAPLPDEDFTTWDADRLARLYRTLEDELLRRWQTPIVNDFFAMIAFGILSRLVERWLPDAPPTLMNDLLAHQGGIISTEPARQVLALARHVDAEPAIAALFERIADDRELWDALGSEPEMAEYRAALDAYLRRFGDRCMNELKLETVTLGEDPAFLLQTIRAYRAGGLAAAASDEGEATIRREAERRVHDSLGAARRRVFHLALEAARARVRDRENLRFERTRVFGTVRRIFLGFGHHLHRTGRISEPRDVFFLTVEEVFAHVDGVQATDDLAALVALRRAEWAEYERESAPPERFESFGPPSLGRWKTASTAAAAAVEGEVLQGTGCCPGVVRAPVRLVRDPREPGELAGHILVAERTDPGWTLLFPAARAVIVERGSLLSHSAIVAREMGLPCIVSVQGLMQTLQDGELVEMDGAAGTIRRLEHGDA